jgi:hypothetical protein
MTSPFSFAAFQAQQKDPPVGPRRSPLSFSAFEEQRRQEEERQREAGRSRDGVLPTVTTTAPAPTVAEKAGQFARGAGLGATQSLTSLGEVAGMVPGLGIVGEKARELEQKAAAALDPQGPYGLGGQVLGRMGGEMFQAVKAAGPVAKGIAKVAPRAGQAIQAGLEGTRLQRALATAATSAPIDVVQGLKEEEGLLLPGRAGSVAENVLFSGGAGALFRGKPSPRTSVAPQPLRELPAGPIQDRARLLGAGPDAPMQGPAIPMGGATPGAMQGPAIPMGGPTQRLLPRPPTPTEGPRLVGPAIPMGGPAAPRQLMSGAPRPTVGPSRLGPEPLPPEAPVAGPAIPMGGPRSVGGPITDPSRLLPEATPDDVRRRAVQMRMQMLFAGQPERAAQIERSRTLAELDRLAAMSPDQMARLKEGRSLDYFPDDTPRIGEKEGYGAPYTRQTRSVRKMSDRDLALEYNVTQGAINRLTQAMGEYEARGVQHAAVQADNVRTRSANLTPAQRRKRTMDERGVNAEKLSGKEKRQLGYDMTEDALERIEDMGMDAAQVRALTRDASEAEKRLPAATRRYEELTKEMERRGIDDLPRDLGPSFSSRLPSRITDEMSGYIDAQVRAGRTGAASPELIAQLGGAGAGAAIGAATAPEGEQGSAIGRALAGAAVGAGAGRAGLAGVRRLGQVTPGAADVPPGSLDPSRPTADAAPVETPDMAAGPTPDRRARAEERVKRPSRPYPSDATYVPRTDEEWREFYGRFMTKPEEIMEADMMRMGGVAQQQQGTRPVAADIKLAEAIGETFGDLSVKDAGRKLSGPELIALRAQREANAARRVALTEKLADPDVSPVDKEWMSSLRDQLEDVMITQFERYTRDVSQTGRDLRLLQEVAKMSDNPADWLLRAERMAGGRRMSPTQELELITAVRNKEFAKAAQTIGSLRQNSVLDQIGELWQTGLLTSFVRPVRDVFGNIANLTDRQIERMVATVADATLGTMTGVRTADYTFAGSFKPLQDGLVRGGQAAMSILRGGGSPEAIQRAAKRYDFERETLQTLAPLKAYTTFIRRTIGAADAMVFDAASSAALGEQARVLARAKGLAPNTPEFNAAVTKYLEAPPPEMLGVALAQANEVTWQNSTMLGDLAMPIRQSKNDLVRLLGKVAVPFVQTPSAMATQTIKGAFGLPTAAVADAPRFLRAVMQKADIPEAQARLVNRIAKGSVGAGWIYSGYTLAENDKMTSWYPSDDRERRRWELEGRTESAIKLGGTWVSLLGVLGPQAQLMAVGAAIRKMMDEDPAFIAGSSAAKLAKSAATAGAGVARATLDSPMMQGVQSVSDLGVQFAKGDPDVIGEAAGRAAQTYIGGVVPQAVQQLARASDITPEGQVRLRQVRVPGDPMQTGINALMQGLPGARQQLPVRRSAFGEERATSVGGTLGVLSPARLSRETQDPAAQELWRTGAAVPRTSQRKGEPQGTFDARQQALGAATMQAVQAAMQNPQYQQIATMDVGKIREALNATMQQSGVPMPEIEQLQRMSDEDVRRRYQGLVLDRIMTQARTRAGAAFPDPRGGRAGSVMRALGRP